MRRSNGGIIGPDNVTTGGFTGVASGVWKLNEVTDLIKQSKWPEPSPFPINVTPNSARFNSASSDNLTRTSDSGNKKTFTMSFWVKRSTLGTDQVLTNITAPSGAQGRVFFEGNTEQLEFHDVSSGGSYEIRYITNRLFRDFSAWYNIVIAVDTEDGTAGDRVKIYVNGVQETSFATATQPSSGLVTSFNSGGVMEIGSQQVPAEFFGGYMSEVINVDGSQLAPTSFGEFNSGSGIWIPKTITGLTFGTNGYYLKFANSAALGTDSSGQSNNFTVNNLTSLDQSTDSPSNNFATMNPLFAGDNSAITYAEGNLKTTATNQGQKNAVSTIGVSSGKWYCEMVSRNGTNYPGFGIMDSQSVLQTSISYLGSSSDSYCMFQDGNYYTNGSAVSTGTTWGVGSIMGVAIDLDSGTKTIKFFKNGSQTHSATISTPANAYVFAVSHNDNGTITEINFGSPAYALSSGNTDANGFGNFEYAVPAGYFSLCTNNLNILE